MDGFEVPVGTFYKSYGDDTTCFDCPLCDSLCVIYAALEVCLHCDSCFEVDGVAGVHECVECEVFEFELFHIEVDEDAVAFCCFEYWGCAGHKIYNRGVWCYWIEVCAQACHFDRDIDAGDDSEMIRFESLGVFPGGCFIDEVVDEVEVFCLVCVCFCVGDTCFT